MQLFVGSVSVENGSAHIIGTGVDWTDAIAGVWFIAKASSPSSPPAQIYTFGAPATETSPGVWEADLTAPFVGGTFTDIPYAIHKDFDPLGFAIFSAGDTEMRAILNRNFQVASTRFLAGGGLGGGAFLTHAKTIAGLDIGALVIAMTFSPTLLAPPLHVGVPSFKKSSIGQDNIYALSIDSVVETGYNVNLSSGAVAGQVLSNYYILDV